MKPDGEAAERLRGMKTGLMQRANQAHQPNDLLILLELQIEQIDANTLGRAGIKLLKHYMKV